MKFYLGTDMPGWLATVPVPLFVSHRRLRPYRTLPVAKHPWCLDSGGFTELSTHGQWTISASEYVAAVQRYMDEIGMMQWAAPQDAMCEPWILDKSQAWLGGTVEAHQRWTVDNYLQLRESCLPFIPVIQGWQHDDYLRHIEMYDKAGIDLTQEPTVGLGSVCRRQATADICALVHRMADMGLSMHGFGVKTSGVEQYGWRLQSADSMAWSFGGRRIKPCPVRKASSCSHCVHHALEWRERVLDKARAAVPYQQEMLT